MLPAAHAGSAFEGVVS